MSQEEQFWSRFLELAQLQLKDSAYDFFVADSKLVKSMEKRLPFILMEIIKNYFGKQI